MNKLDKLDRKILHALEKNARLSTSQIAKKVRTSQQVVSYRLQQLQKNEVITGFYTIINFAKLGYSSYRTMFRLQDVTTESYSHLLNFLKKHTNVLWLIECGGKYDLIVNILAKNPVQYNNFLLEIRTKFKKIIQDYETLLTIEGISFGRDYLSETPRENSSSYFGREITEENLEKFEFKILSTLAENARANAVEISQKLNVSPNTIINKIKKLKQQKIIQGFKPLIHLEKIDYQSYKALVNLHPLSEEDEKELINHFHSNKNIVGILKMIGSWNFEVEFEVSSREEMLNISRKIREKLKDNIKEFEVIPFFHEYKYNFFPGDLIKNI